VKPGPKTGGFSLNSPKIQLAFFMSDIVFKCPATKRVVPTGLTTEKVKLNSLSGISFKLRCPACLRIHTWRSKDAWEHKEEPKPELR
jgi:hypothetical protein